MLVPQHIKNVIFDFGAVILDIDASRTVDAFKALGVGEFDSFQQFLTAHYKQELFHDIEKGTISPAEFRDAIRSWASQPLADEEIDTAWNAMLVGYRKERLDLLVSLKGRYRTFLLSNTNIIHWEFFTKMLQPFGYEGLHQFFEKDYYSHTLHMRKPDSEIYQFVLDNSRLVPSETLFLDDNEMNIEGARKMGIHAIQIKPELSINDVFRGI